jgi:hypothetical protein
MLSTSEDTRALQRAWQHVSSTSSWSPQQLSPGPYWRSFEQFRVAGSAALDEIRIGCVATLHSKSMQYRVLRDDDFQRLLGLASDVHRLKAGFRVVMHAARIVAKHPTDEETIKMLIASASLFADSCTLPEREGHGSFDVPADELPQDDDLDAVEASAIPRPKL